MKRGRAALRALPIASGSLPFSELKQRACINKRAPAADQDPDFSRLIRANLPHID